MVYNPLNVEREDIVEAALSFPGAPPSALEVLGPDGKAVPSQWQNGKLLFLAKVPSVGYAVFTVQPAATEAQSHELKVTNSSLENTRYRVTLNENGDVASIFDKSLNRELLSTPMQLAISNDAPRQWPAWNMDFDQEQAAPRSYVAGPATVRIVENGPVRVALEASREAEGSKFVQTVRLSAGDPGNRVEFSDAVDWKALSANLKAVFPLTATNRNATYNSEVGTVERPTAYDRQFEVASHHWIDLTDQSGSYGATILTDVKNGSDKRDDHTIRLTLLRTPGFPPAQGGTGPANAFRRAYSDQLNQDWGHHEILFGLAGHTGDWRQGQTEWQAYRLSTPLLAFQTEKHPGALGRTFSLMSISSPQIRALALKKAESSDDVILRLVETDGQPASNVTVKFAGHIAAAREVNAQEQPLGRATLRNGALQTSFKPYQPRTFALRLAAPQAHMKAPSSQPVTLQYDLATATEDDTKSTGGFDGKGSALPAEMLPSRIDFGGVMFHLAPAGASKPNAVVAHGQTIDLPPGPFNRLYVLAASADGDQKITFQAGDRSFETTVQDWGGFVGQWDTRLWKPRPGKITTGGYFNVPVREVALRKDWAVSAHHATWNLEDRGSPTWSPRYPEDYISLRPGFIKRAGIAWYASHHHTPDGLNEPYAYSYLFAYGIDIPPGTATLKLPDTNKVRVLAVSVAQEEAAVTPVQPLYDTLSSDARKE